MRHPGVAEFVPEESRARRFTARFHPRLVALQARRECGIDTLLDVDRLLALTELARDAVRRLDGELIELGVYRGGSAAAVAMTLETEGIRRPLHLCDTFTGLPVPREWEVHRAGDFEDTARETAERALRLSVPDYPIEIHEGLFAETLPTLAERRFCFAHVDADLYDSVREACEFVYPRLAAGGFMVFDDYGAPTCPGARRAVDEFFADKMERPRHVAQSAYGIQKGVRIPNFERIVLRRTLLRAAATVLRQVPRRCVGAVTRRIEPVIISPKVNRAIAEPLFRLFRGQRATTGVNIRDAKSVLVVRLDEIGDLVLLTAFLRELRRNLRPGARVTLIVKPGARDLVERCPYTDEVLTFDWTSRRPLAAARLHARTLQFAMQYLWKQRFDLALVPRWDADYYYANFLAYLSGAGARIGYSERVTPLKQKVNCGADQLLTQPLFDDKPKHEVERNLDVLRAIGGEVRAKELELWLSPEDELFAEQACAASEGARLVAFGVGAGAAKRRWPASRFAEVAQGLCQQMATRILVVGGPEDAVAADILKRKLGRAVIDLTGKTTLRQTAAVLKKSEFFIGNDAGPMHIAAAMGVPVIEICCQTRDASKSHSNSPARFGPWGVDAVALQPEQRADGCSDACEAEVAHCILGVSVADVFAGVNVLRGARQGQSHCL